MRIKAMLGTMGLILLLFSLSLGLPIIVGMFYDESLVENLIVFGLPMVITLMLGGLFYYAGNDELDMLREREAFVAVSLGWLLIAFVGALPYLLSSTLTDPVDAYFESMSGFATCGATVIQVAPNSTDYLVGPDAYSHSIFFWRALTQWLGGMGMIVLSVVILAKILGGGISLFKAEAAGDSVTRLMPKIQQTAAVLWAIYAGLTFLLVGLLMMAGLNLYDAICHSFTCLATGGYSPHAASIAHYDSPLVEGLITTFIIIGSLNFVLYFRMLRGDVKSFFKDPQLRFFLGIIALATAIITINLVRANVYSSWDDSFRFSVFQVVTMNGCAGFVSADFTQWPMGSQYLLVFLMLIGGCVGSTAGAIKISRVIILLKIARREIQKVIHPRAVIPIKMGGQVISDEMLTRIGVFFFSYLLIFLLGTIGLLFASPTVTNATGSHTLTIGESASAIATAMGGVGPGLGKLAADCAGLSTAGKILMSLCMWIGRLEIFSAIIIFFPSTYRR